MGLAWIYKDEPYDETPDEYQGFVYVITELDTDKKYLGKKNFWRPKTLPKNSKRNRRVRTRVESDWREYYGSNKELQLLVESRGESNYKREIIRLCRTKGEMSYFEAKAQFDNGVLFSDKWYNEFIGCKIHSRHIRGLQSEETVL
tara:strand:- start:422 stop:856 length:435 start_codon:yes stop_codon:yes gene_type:complete